LTSFFGFSVFSAFSLSDIFLEMALSSAVLKSSTNLVKVAKDTSNYKNTIINK
jgi:hypothetical protein